MIDTIRLNLYDCLVKSPNDLIIKNEKFNNIDSSFDLFIDENGEIKQGNNAYINNKYFNLSILPKFDINRFQEHKIKVLKPDFIHDNKSDYIFERNILKQYLNINFKDNKNANFILQTSLSKLYSYLIGDKNKNINYLNEKQIKQSFNFLFLKLKDSGIIADLDNANLIRLDLFINLKTDYSYSAYKNILRSIYLSRREQTEKEYSFLFSNKQNQLSIYDKKKELELFKINIDNELMRFENRFLTKQKINKLFFGNITDKILNQKKHLDEMKNIHDNIFNKTNNDIIVDKNFESILKSSKSLRDFQNNIFYYYLQTNFDFNYLRDQLKNNLNKRSFYRTNKTLQQLDFDKMKKNNISLFAELKNKYEDEITMLESKLI